MEAGRPAETTTPDGPRSTVLDGRYRLGALIARGGMSAVYRGVDLRLDRPVAIKILKDDLVRDPTFLARFDREARTAAALHHRGIVAVYDQGRDGDTVFLVMELVDGGTLRDLLTEHGAMSVPVALSILEPVLSALGAAHEAGLVHRDVKPENVLISTRGEVKVADFGLVRAVTSTTVATGDVILGTVAYLSPEQVSTGFSDARSDVYSAGVLGFEMLTGRPPFDGGTALSVAYQHVHEDVPAPSTLAIGVPAPLDEIMVRATARNSSDRPADAAEFLSELIRMRARLLIRRVPVPVPTPARPAHATRVMPAARPRTDGDTDSGRVADRRDTGPGAGDTTFLTTATPPQRQTAPVADGATQVVARRPEPAEPQRRRRRRRAWIIGVVVLLLASAAGVGGWWFGSGRYTTVPTLVGQARESAVQTVESAGLVAVVSEAHDNRMAAGRVAAVDPAEGARELRGSEIRLVVSTGRPVVPAIEAGTAPDDAETALTAADLTVTRDEAAAVFDAEVPAGAVVRTEPAAGTALDIGAPVTLVVSKGAEPVPVPAVTDKTVVDAENALKVAGFGIGTQVDQFDPERPAGTVIGTRPAAGETLAAGATVQLVVSSSLVVPDVVGSSQADATATLQGAKLTVTVGPAQFDSDVDGGDVIRTDPAAGTLVDPAASTVTVTVSNAVTMPDVRGRNVDEAGGQLTGAGLYVQVTSFFGLGSTVQSQDPAPGTRVEPGATVSLNTFN
ncbi:Stk1 family PASTA domain-containing Ser/Thr kinase [Nakamurella deserti]|uniref:Stk1 family PASTA domain-containing Ser/Thr kinase n=1 Tax=Nakamurella deserti TaxID=2164074 RepID=UPI000DBE79E0|nr:Stk1 family PASTA domain-containing Ser/Thr kinase [Nakamurella deserti]